MRTRWFGSNPSCKVASSDKWCGTSEKSGVEACESSQLQVNFPAKNGARNATTPIFWSRSQDVQSRVSSNSLYTHGLEVETLDESRIASSTAIIKKVRLWKTFLAPFLSMLRYPFLRSNCPGATGSGISTILVIAYLTVH